LYNKMAAVLSLVSGLMALTNETPQLGTWKLFRSYSINNSTHHT